MPKKQPREICQKYRIKYLKNENEGAPNLSIPETNLTKFGEDKDLAVCANWYRCLICLLLYLATSSRPDTEFGVYVLSRFMHKPAVRQIEFVLQLIVYISRIRSAGLLFNKDDKENPRLNCYCEADIEGPEIN
jgi:hypothetical protein